MYHNEATETIIVTVLNDESDDIDDGDDGSDDSNSSTSDPDLTNSSETSTPGDGQNTLEENLQINGFVYLTSIVVLMIIPVVNRRRR